MELWDLYDRSLQPTGRTHVRGEPVPEGLYHLVVHVWIQNRKGEYLLSKRACGRKDAQLWECTRGSALAGESGAAAALREACEELGVALRPENGTLLKTLFRSRSIVEVWLFRHEVELEALVLQRDEVCAARWSPRDEIERMMRSSEMPAALDYPDTLFRPDRPVVFFPDYTPGSVRFAVIAAMHRGSWVFVRHRDRATYEMPGGHIEPGEAPADTARRELYEESGALDFTVEPVCVYGVGRGLLHGGADSGHADDSYGVLFFAQVREFGELPPFEMSERILARSMPERLTYPEIQPRLLDRVQRWLDARGGQA